METNSLSFRESMHHHMNERIQVYAVYPMAFDKINHNLLLTCLSEFVEGGALFRWVEFHVKNRSQDISMQSCYSAQFAIIFGIPQGSHLEAPYFSLFILMK